MSEPLVWLPFEPEELGEVPEGLRYEVHRRGEDGLGRLALEEVAFYVPPYESLRSDSELVPHMRGLEVVQTMTAGVEHIRPFVPDGVLLCNGRGIHDASTAELALTLTLASLRGIPGFVRAQDRQQWTHRPLEALADKRVLIVGYGQIGAAIEERLLPFEVAAVDRVARTARPGVHAVTELPELLPLAEVVVLVVPATGETRGMVDRDFLRRMKDGALLVNVARGSIVVGDDLLAELRTGRISAAIDVTDPEPLPVHHPLWSAPNLLISPHVGGASSAMWPRAYRLVREQLQRYVRGEPLVNQMTGDY
ncbi:MAG TPA: 2-hydroxyacid dehydrogenase [Marmoricola sp.]|nr:2-hydroxyacid dehydrogenase [Marmoricola sp.]